MASLKAFILCAQTPNEFDETAQFMAELSERFGFKIAELSAPIKDALASACVAVSLSHPRAFVLVQSFWSARR